MHDSEVVDFASHEIAVLHDVMAMLHPRDSRTHIGSGLIEFVYVCDLFFQTEVEHRLEEQQLPGRNPKTRLEGLVGGAGLEPATSSV